MLDFLFGKKDKCNFDPKLAALLQSISVSLIRLYNQGERIMSAISEFAAKVNQHQAKIDEAVTGISGDIAALKQMIADLQNNPGPISPEDQALLDQIEARIGATAERVKALDDLTPPPSPNPA